jgi:hypothetical protein
MSIASPPPEVFLVRPEECFEIREDRKAVKHYTPEEIVARLRQVDVLISQGWTRFARSA